jgi:hypothetical protein
VRVLPLFKGTLRAVPDNYVLEIKKKAHIQPPSKGPWSYIEPLFLSLRFLDILYVLKFLTLHITVVFPPYRNTCCYWLFSTILTIRLIQKIVQVQFIFACYMFYCSMYFKLDFLFCMFEIIFWIRRFVLTFFYNIDHSSPFVIFKKLCKYRLIQKIMQVQFIFLLYSLLVYVF